MKRTTMIPRRSILKSGAGALVGAAAGIAPRAVSAKQPGETKVLFLLGDYHHPGVPQELAWRRVLGPTGWRLMFAQTSAAVTAEELADTDLFVMCRYAGADVLGFSTDLIVENRPRPPQFMTDDLQDALIANVNRGMGLVALHCTIWNGTFSALNKADRTPFLDLLGVQKTIPHTRLQPAEIHAVNQDHPITRGIEGFNTGVDEIFNAELIPGRSELLFKTKGELQPVDANGGWCSEVGDGRVVVLLPGHNYNVYHKKSYKEIMWRTAHWALDRSIPPSDVTNGRNDVRL
jgi:trehalose utilization protein